MDELRTRYEINKSVWYNPGDKVLVRTSAEVVDSFECIECLWDKVILSNGFYNFCVSKADIYYRLPITVRD